jgi:hypothetical protein
LRGGEGGFSWEPYALIDDVINYFHDYVEVWKVMSRYLRWWRKRTESERKFVFFTKTRLEFCVMIRDEDIVTGIIPFM